MNKIFDVEVHFTSKRRGKYVSDGHTRTRIDMGTEKRVIQTGIRATSAAEAEELVRREMLMNPRIVSVEYIIVEEENQDG